MRDIDRDVVLSNTESVLKRQKRIMIFGLPGSGKSTFAVRLARLLHLPVVHLDKYFFIHNWNKRDHEDFLKIQLYLQKLFQNYLKSLRSNMKSQILSLPEVLIVD